MLRVTAGHDIEYPLRSAGSAVAYYLQDGKEPPIPPVAVLVAVRAQLSGHAAQPAGTPVVEIVRTAYTDSGQAVEVNGDDRRRKRLRFRYELRDAFLHLMCGTAKFLA